MNNIDLIPQAYRTHRWQSRWLKYAGAIMGGLLIVFTVGFSALNSATASARSRVEVLQVRQTVTAQQRVELEQLSSEKAELERQFDLLSGLRSGAAAEDMFVAIDRALIDDDLWFVEWNFERAGVVVGEGVQTVNTGYFIVVPQGNEPAADGAMRVRTNMTIRGQSRDHSALSGFVKRLFEQAEIDDVRVRRTSVSRDGQTRAVDFELGITLKTDVRAK